MFVITVAANVSVLVVGSIPTIVALSGLLTENCSSSYNFNDNDM